MKIALICTNLFNMDAKNKTGSGIFNFILAAGLAKHKKRKHDFTVFASGNSSLPLRVRSIDAKPSCADPRMLQYGKHIMFELALISKAFSEQSRFDLYHVNIGDGDLVMPFAAFVQKPILITLHNINDEDFTRKYFSLFQKQKNVHFVSVSEYQRKILPQLNYFCTINHGIDTEQFKWNARGGDNIMWAGRYIPEKGPDTVVAVAKKTKRAAKLFGVVKLGYEDWLESKVKGQVRTRAERAHISFHSDYERQRLVKPYQNSRLFLHPVSVEEAFGLVFIEAMACGTPVVTYARGSAPEIIRDGITGFLVNPTDEDIRGDWIIKKTGLAGLCEAVERVYALSAPDYALMRQACRAHVLENFSAEKMTKKYLEAYERLIRGSHDA